VQLITHPAVQLLPATHSLLLLSDSALPLGSFAYSSGLESYIAHHKPLPKSLHQISSFHRFFELSVASVAGTTIPYLLAAYRSPGDLEQLDNDLDASTPCTVARRASIAQGLALLGVWEKAFRESNLPNESNIEVTSLEQFSDALRDGSAREFPVNGHFAPLWAVVTRSMGLDASQSAYVFLVNHAKAVLSAAVRASVMGPYQAQTVLASRHSQELITRCVESEWTTRPEDAGQVVPALDLWVGRHELLYSRIFNS
jgi:urease accessory protein